MDPVAIKIARNDRLLRCLLSIETFWQDLVGTSKILYLVDATSEHNLIPSNHYRAERQDHGGNPLDKPCMNPSCRVLTHPSMPNLQGKWGLLQPTARQPNVDLDRIDSMLNRVQQSTVCRLLANACRLDQLLTNSRLRSYVQHRVALMAEYVDEFI